MSSPQWFTAGSSAICTGRQPVRAMSETQVWLLRHGASTFNAQHRCQGSCDEPELTPQGREEARLSAERLSSEGIEAVISSPLRRASDTAEHLLKAIGAQGRKITFETDARLREIELYHWEGLPLEEIPVGFPNNTAIGVSDRASSGCSWPITRFNTPFAAFMIACACFGIISSQLTPGSPSCWCRTVELFARSSPRLSVSARCTSTVSSNLIAASADFAFGLIRSKRDWTFSMTLPILASGSPSSKKGAEVCAYFSCQ